MSALNGKSLTTPYADYIGALSAAAKTAADNVTAQTAIHDTIYAQQQAISGVSLDEEATDMIRFQHAYQAATRVITSMDEMLDTLINRTGIVGR